MGNHRLTGGQTIVELALVLPCFCLGIFMAVQLMKYCHNMVSIQRMATVAINRVTIENYKDAHNHHWFHNLHGRVSQPKDHYTSVIPQTWKPFRGISTISDRGLLARVTVQSTLFPSNGFGRVLSKAVQEAHAETFLEPPLPEENE